MTQPGKHSPYRDRSVEENLALFEKMRAGEFAEGSACLRAGDVASSFMVMRDPVYIVCVSLSITRRAISGVYTRCTIFTHYISDALEGITHSLCTLEFQDNRRLYDWVLDNITVIVSRISMNLAVNLEYTVMSKRKLNQLVTENLVDGWDDPHANHFRFASSRLYSWFYS